MKILIIISCFFLGGCMTGQQLNDRESRGVVSKTMQVKFEVPVEDATIVSYGIYRSTQGGYFWTIIKTIPANKKNNSVYTFDVASNYGYYRVRTNKTKGTITSSKLYVNK